MNLRSGPSLGLDRRLRGGRRRANHGFTLVEIMVVVLIISVLASVTVPSFMRIQLRSKTTAIVNDFRIFASAFDVYAQENGAWPAETAAGVIPAVMATHLNASAWQRKTPMGGQYNWENNQMHFGVRYQAGIAISATASAPLTLDVPQLTDIEHVVDGKTQINWTSGNFHIGTGLIPLYIVQP